VSASEAPSDGSGSSGHPRSRQPMNPPSRGRTRVTPSRLSVSATRALVASFGHEQ
jgi:hypothetical protein